MRHNSRVLSPTLIARVYRGALTSVSTRLGVDFNTSSNGKALAHSLSVCLSFLRCRLMCEKDGDICLMIPPYSTAPTPPAPAFWFYILHTGGFLFLSAPGRFRPENRGHTHLVGLRCSGVPEW